MVSAGRMWTCASRPTFKGDGEDFAPARVETGSLLCPVFWPVAHRLLLCPGPTLSSPGSSGEPMMQGMCRHSRGTGLPASLLLAGEDTGNEGSRRAWKDSHFNIT